ncbi:MAG: hypothetical protein WC544_01925 [Patescibacteria group bacterium]
MYTALLFDWGGIFTSQADLREFCRQYSTRNGFDFNIFNNKMRELWDAARVNLIDSRLFWTELSVIAGVTPDQLHADLDTFSGFEPDVMDFCPTTIEGTIQIGHCVQSD